MVHRVSVGKAKLAWAAPGDEPRARPAGARRRREAVLKPCVPSPASSRRREPKRALESLNHPFLRGAHQRKPVL